MFIDIPDYWRDDHKHDWRQFDITPQDFRRRKAKDGSIYLIVDHPGINAAFTDFEWMRNGKLHIWCLHPFEQCSGHVWLSWRYRSTSELCQLPDADFDYQMQECFCTDAEWLMIAHLLYPDSKRHADLLDYIQIWRSDAYRDRDGVLYPHLDLPEPYNDIVYRDFAEPWKLISIQ